MYAYKREPNTAARNHSNDLVRAHSGAAGTVRPSAFAVLRVDHQVELGRLLDGKVRGLGTLQDFVHVFRYMTKVRGDVRSIAQQPARDHVLAPAVGHRQQRGLESAPAVARGRSGIARPGAR